jgi:hypothetical protein
VNVLWMVRQMPFINDGLRAICHQCGAVMSPKRTPDGDVCRVCGSMFLEPEQGLLDDEFTDVA